MKQIFTKATDMDDDETKRNQADLDLFGKLVSDFKELEEGGVSDVHLWAPLNENCLHCDL